MRLTEFGKAIGRGQGQEAGPTFYTVKECVWAEADFASHCTRVKKEMMCGSRKELTGVLAT